MSNEQSPGKAAYEMWTFQVSSPITRLMPWNDLPERARAGWEEIAQAAITAASCSCEGRLCPICH